MGATASGLVLALWAVPATNLAWSVVTKHRDRVRADFARGMTCVPLATYIYAADAEGVLSHMWLPALMVSLGVCLSVGIGTRKLTGGVAIALAYALGVFAVGRLEADATCDAIALLLADVIVSIVAVHLGRSFVETARRRDEATEQRRRAEVTLAQLAERTNALSAALTERHREIELRKQIEADLVQAQKLESVGRLAAGIAHEINTPVQFVGDSLQFVRYAVDDLLALVRGAIASDDVDLEYLSDEVPKALGRADDGLRRVTRIVRSMKVFAHPAVEMAHADLNGAIEATLTIAHNEYKYVADLITDLGPDLPPVSCFMSELNQALLNIVVNAAHAIGDVVGGTGARGTIEVRTRRDGDDVVISIRDTGSGIPEAIRPHIFDPFFTTKEVGKGTGQGLAIAHAVVVDKHRGKLWFETQLGSGTTFFIRIPIAGAPVTPTEPLPHGLPNMPSRYSTISPVTAEAATVSGEAR
ncbi:MAG TPA: ATP-binding protein [Kofleriaceae bacterium]|nr:ATP-binding protein [Kofleriaceae bacterium]